jgi:hypothetical protein
VQQVAVYVDFKVDESYTPNKISIRAGNSFHDLRVNCSSNFMLSRGICNFLDSLTISDLHCPVENTQRYVVKELFLLPILWQRHVILSETFASRKLIC